MLLTLGTTHQPATDLGYLLHKHPDRLQTFELAFGTAQVFYPVAEAERCTMALLLDINAVELTRGKVGSQQVRSIADYVSDRPYVASSFLSVAIAQLFRTAMAGTCQQRPDLPDRLLPLEVHLPVLPSRGGEGFLRALFDPLGYQITLQRLPLDPAFPQWGDSRYFDVHLSHTLPLKTLLSHLYVLMPVLDDDKHYFVNAEEIDKLLRHGAGWLAEHPLKDEITRRYLKRQGKLTQSALEQLGEALPAETTIASSEVDETEVVAASPSSPLPTLNQQRLQTVVNTLKTQGAQRVVDLGCGEGRLLCLLQADQYFTAILGMDVSYRTLEIAQRRLKLENMGNDRLRLIQGSLTYQDDRLVGYDGATLVEVIEHLESDRLGALAQTVFGDAQPPVVIVTTPNQEYNSNYPSLPPGQLRHRDHRFEWTRAEFTDWAKSITDRYPYQVSFQPIGDLDPQLGPPTQMAIFTVIKAA